MKFSVPQSARQASSRLGASTLFEEAFRTLRSNLLLRVREGHKCFLVTSAKPREGKSTIVTNLAQMLATGNRKVLLVDADLRRPRLHELFGIPNQQGLTDLLAGTVAPKGVYHRIGDSLTVLTSGTLPRDPQELFSCGKSVRVPEVTALAHMNGTSGGRLERLVGNIKRDFDMILFDSAPLLAFADSTLLASRMDGVILVVRSGELTTPEAHVVRERLRGARARLVGCVLSCVPGLNVQVEYPYATQYAEVPSEAEPRKPTIERLSLIEGSRS